MGSHVRMLDVHEQTLNVSPSSRWTSQKTKGLGWQLVTVAGEHTGEVRTPRARRTSVVVDFSAVGFRETKRRVPHVRPLLQEGG